MAYGPWNQEQIDAARDVAFPVLLEHLGAYYKLDAHFTPSDASRRSQRVQVAYQGRDFVSFLLGVSSSTSFFLLTQRIEAVVAL